MNQQILSLYALWEENGTEKLIEAVRFCHKEQVYGAAYVELMLLKGSGYSKSSLHGSNLDPVEINWKKTRISDKL